jgi:SOS-response transcriptional repressor LexA
MERQLTDKQIHTLRFIYDYIKSNGYAPTRKEIKEALSVSTSVACGRVNHLFVYGYLREPETKQRARNIVLTEKGIRACEG